MAGTHFTQFDATKLKDWLSQMFDLAESAGFVLGIQRATEDEMYSQLVALRILNGALLDGLRAGHERFIS
jgi:hypothetical protein